ncbi:unnamed protein product [Knipowitschia caucasica]|uniref:Uncharacterized protein n=1 Tax=Knipowitschia caucasica TaxID=637954 RepID=A0AAV2JKY1_KNICA
MRSLLDSSWQFGPAGRDSLEWTGPSPLPSTDQQLAGQSSGDALGPRSLSSIAAGCLSLLLLLSLLLFLLWRRRRGLHLDGKLGLAGVIALEDLQDPERNCELLSSLRREHSMRQSQRRRSQRLPSSSSEQEVGDGVFLMVYLPPPYEQTLTRLARAASIRDRDEDAVTPSSSLDSCPKPGLDPAAGLVLDPPPRPGLDPSPGPSLDPPPSSGLDPPSSPGPLLNLSPGPDTKAPAEIMVIEESEIVD